MSEQRFKAQFAGVRESVWSGNAITFATQAEARDHALDLLCRWTGADMARVVPAETPTHEPIDPADPAIVANYRRARA